MDRVNENRKDGDGKGECPKTASLETRIKSFILSKRPSLGTDESLLKTTKKAIGRFFYQSGLEFHAVNLPSFRNMISICSGPVGKQQIPTRQELEGWIFDDMVKEMRDRENEIRHSWAETGCSVLLDEWTDGQGRNLVNILVDSPRGAVYHRSADISDCIGNVNMMHSFIETLLSEVGIDNVVQIMSCSTTEYMREVGKNVMEKYRPIFWTFCGCCCVELMLEKMSRMNPVKETLEKAKTITRFFHAHPDLLKHVQEPVKGRNLLKYSKTQSAQPFLTLQNIELEKETLKEALHSSDNVASTVNGKHVAILLSDQSFWNDTATILKGTIPLVRVIDWMNDPKQEQMGDIYELIDSAKLVIKEELANKKSQYMPFWEVIDIVWNDFLYSPLHSAGYFFNPGLFYSEDSYIDSEVAAGVLCCIVRSTADTHKQDKITLEMEKYRRMKGPFSVGRTDDKSDISPANWWREYGVECPNLQRLTLRVLSQTCDGATKFQLNRSLAETLFSQGRTEMEQKRLSDLVFLRYNMQLQDFHSGKTGYIVPDTANGAMDDWISGDMV